LLKRNANLENESLAKEVITSTAEAQRLFF
jgi:hypothetical protein